MDQVVSEPRSPCMVQTKFVYKASWEPITVLQQHHRPSHSKGTTSTMTNTEDQPSGTGDPAAKVDKLNKDLESVITWIQDQPPKAHVTPVKERYAEYKFEDDDVEDGDDNNKKVHGPHYPFKVEARIDNLTYDGTVYAEKLDSWIDQLETYFTLYGFSSHVTLGISIDTKDVFTKYVVGLPQQIQTEMRLQTTKNISEASSIAMAIELKNKSSSLKFEESSKGEELFLKKWIKDDRSGKRTTATTQSLNTKEQPDKKEELFTLHIQVKQELIEAIVDTGSQKNMISAGLVQRLGLTTTPHPRPYSLGWIQKDMDPQVNKQSYPTVFEDVCDIPMNQVSEHDGQLIADSTPPKVGPAGAGPLLLEIGGVIQDGLKQVKSRV
ncbi:glutamate-rich WD repeat-containing protein 1 [Tanacetum coccineum]